MSTPSSRGIFLDIEHHGYSEAIARRFSKIRIGSESYSMSKLRDLDEQEHRELVRQCLRNSYPEGIGWLFAAIYAQTNDLGQAWRRVWEELDKEPQDGLLLAPLVYLLRNLNDPAELLPYVGRDVRACALIGQLCQDECNLHNVSDKEWFDLYRDASIAFFNAARQVPNNMFTARQHEYVESVGPMLEAVMYLSFISPRRSSSSGSSLGGG